jgi:hypothetical protein
MSAFVIDVNVPIVANGCSPQADDECMRKCVETLMDVHSSGKIVLDDGLAILKEYMDHLSMSGKPGLGDFFMRWIWENQAVEAVCERVHLTLASGNTSEFNEFPDDPALSRFDKSDRKYVAAALASAHSPVILNAVDSDWWDFRISLQANGVRICFLCPQCMTE